MAGLTVDVGQVLYPASATVLAGAVALGSRYVVRAMTRLGDRWENIQRDLYGEPARLGVPAVPGGLERLGKAEAAVAAHGLRLDSHDQRLASLERLMSQPAQGP